MARFPFVRAKVAAVVAAVLLSAGAGLAREGVPLAQDVASDLSGPVRAGEHVVIPRLALDDGSEVSLDLQAFEVFAPGATILDYTDKGPRLLPPPQDRYFRGTVIGDPDSLVVLIKGAKLRGFIQTEGVLYTIAPERNVYGDNLPDPVSNLRRVDLAHGRPTSGREFHCETESLVTPWPAPQGTMVASALGLPSTCGGTPNWTSTVYAISLAVETDYEFYRLFNSVDAEIRYIGDLTAAASAIYYRDISTVFQIGIVHLYSSTGGAYPWSGPYSTTTDLLYALGDYWDAHYPKVSFPRTTVHMLSGKSLFGGVAWLGTLCASDMLCQNNNCGSTAANGHYAGAYGVSTSLAGGFSTTNPSLYWDLQCYTHEIGHNFGTPHTHCYSPPVDHCYNTEGSCYSGTICSNGTSDPCNIGTIMSYCHLQAPGHSNINMYFGNSSLAVPSGCQPSQAVRDCMRAFAESRASCLTQEGAGPTVTGVSPATGSTSGGTSVTVSGTGFQYYAAVTIGGVNATGVTTVNSTTITATTGAHPAGTVDVVVRNPDNQSGSKTNAYTYGSFAPPPSVTSVYPNFGPAAGGVNVTITGSSFVSGATVTLGGVAATGVTFVNSTTLTLTTPAHATGTVNVVVQNPDSQTGTLTNGYFYGPAAIGTLFYSLTPCRVLDTRNATGPLGGPALNPGATRTFTVLTVPATCAIPLTAKTLSVNVTVTGPTAAGELRLYPGDGLPVSTSTISFAAGRTLANNAHLLLATDGTGSFKVQNNSSGTLHLILDVNGYYQ